MRKTILTLSLLTAFSAMSFAEKVVVCNPPSIKLKEPPRLENPESFSMILYGDSQRYLNFDFSQPIFELMTAWTASHKDVLKIKAVLGTGDNVDKNDLLLPMTPKYKRINGNTPSMDMWKKVARAYERLDGVLPYILATGNHDYGHLSSENRNSYFNTYFPILKNKCWQDCLVATHANALGYMSLENAAYEFEDANWGKILVIALEYAPRDSSVEWARNLTKSERFKNHKVIILTHSVLQTNKKGVTLIEKEKTGFTDANYGKALMEKLVDDSDNIKLVICGHSGYQDRFYSNIEYKNASGRVVHVMMFNPQTCGGRDGNGGDGWLRIMEFMPDGKTISMRTYSPLFAASAVTQDFAWRKDKDAQFKIEIN